MGAKKNNKPANGKAKPAKAENDSKQPWWFNEPLPIDRFTGWLGIWTAFLSMATIGLGVVAVLQWRELHKTDETLRETLVVNQRPWVDLEAQIDGPFTINDQIAFLPLKVSLKNVGISPAVNIRIRAIMFNVNPRPMTLVEMKSEWCSEELSGVAVPLEDWYIILFPNESQTVPLNASLSRNSESDNGEQFDRLSWNPSIVICMDYRATFNSQELRTIKFLQLGEKDSGGPFEPRKGAIAKEDLVLLPYGNYAE